MKTYVIYIYIKGFFLVQKFITISHKYFSFKKKKQFPKLKKSMLPLQLKLRELEEALVKEYKNLNKSKNRPRTQNGIDEKRAKLYDIILKYKTTIANLEFRLPSKEWNKEVLKYNNLKLIRTNANKILDETKILPSATFKAAVKAIIFCRRLSHNFIKMPAVDIKLGTSVIATYDGSPDNLNTFLDAVSLFQDTVNTEFAAATAEQRAAADATIFKFIKTRLTGIARQTINGANSTDEIVQKLKEQCSPKATSDSLRAKLKAAKQKGNLTQFCEEIEQLTSRLASQYIDETIPANKANQMATKTGIETLINGISNSEAKLILKAGNFSKISEATQKLQEGDFEVKPHSNVFYARGNQPQRGRGRERFNNGRYRNQNYRPTNGGQGNQNRFPSYRQNYNQPNFGYNNSYQPQQNRFPNQRGRGNRGSWNGTPRFSYQHPQQQRPQQMYFAQIPQITQQPTQQVQLVPQQMQQQHIQQQPTLPNTLSQANFLGIQHGPRTQ